MKLKASFINRGILLNDFKRFAWIGACYLLVLLFSVPLKVFMLYSKLEDAGINYVYNFSRIFQFDSNQSFLHVMSLILVPVLTGLLLFRYLQDSRAADVNHSFPVKRETLYNTHIAAGITLLFVPLILNALISWALVAGLEIEYFNSNVILSWLLISLLINLLFFLSSVAVGMITGMTALQGVLSYILLLLPSGLSMLLLHNANIYVYGFAYDYYSFRIDRLSPLLRLTEISSYPMQAGEIAVYLFSSIVLYYAGRRLYQRRHLEAAGNAIAFNVLRPLFKYSVTFCFMLLLGSYFNSDQGSPGWTYFGYFLGSLLAYFLVEILLNKSLQVFQWRRIRGYGIYALSMLGLIGLFHYDFTGFEKRLPDLAEVKSVYMDYSFCPLNYVPAANAQGYGAAIMASQSKPYSNKYDYPVKAIFTEKDNLAGIHSLHQEIVANRLANKESLSSKRPFYFENVCLAYEMKNGSRIYRQYQIAAPEYAEWLKPICESREYKELHNRILGLELADVDLLEINAIMANKTVRLTDLESIARAVAALQNDTNQETFEEIKNIKQKPPWAQVTIILKNNYRIGLDWKKSYANFEQFLKETGKYDQARLLPGEDIASAIVDRMSDLDQMDPDKHNAVIKETIQELEKKPGVLKITDPEKLELCLQNYSTSREQAAYKIVFLLNNGGVFSEFFSEADAPAFVKEHFERSNITT